ncbi:MAG: hypothetical protein I8H94_04645 [Rhodobacteraceae bacterium]|nr:hypothetical protein [Paracoccaceae bacterium]
MMAARKDMMRIIRQDAGYSAKLGFGGIAGAGPESETPTKVHPDSVDAGPMVKTAALAVETVGRSSVINADLDKPRHDVQVESLKEEAGQSALSKPSIGSAGIAAGSARGQVVYVAVSLTTRQARLAEAWAVAARCSVQFLIRRVAQSLREDVFDDWEINGMPDVDEPRGSRGKHPTSVTFTLRPQFAAALSKQHDPLGIVGLGRTMGPAFRVRFQVAFDDALAKAKIQTTNEGDEK